jgi:hypothetical protein
MTMASGDIDWGATIDATPATGQGMREWRVELGSEALAPFAVEPTLTRFADDLSRLAPDAVSACSLTSGRFGMILTITAPGPEEAADEGTRIFKGLLETAIWPRSIPASFEPCDVAVVPAEGAPAHP